MVMLHDEAIMLVNSKIGLEYEVEELFAFRSESVYRGSV